METENSQEEVEFANPAEEILSILETRKTLVYCLHTLLDQFELHLDNITKRYKGMTVTWLIGNGAAIGFIFSTELRGFQINKLIAAALIFLFGVIGVLSIWILDILVFHKFWGAFYLEEIKMEKTNPFLIDIGEVSASLDNIKARIFGSGGFYSAINVLLISASGVTLSFLAQDYGKKAFILLATGYLAKKVLDLMNTFCRKLCASLEALKNKTF